MDWQILNLAKKKKKHLRISQRRLLFDTLREDADLEEDVDVVEDNDDADFDLNRLTEKAQN